MASTRSSGREWAHLVCNERTRTTLRLRGDVQRAGDGLLGRGGWGYGVLLHCYHESPMKQETISRRDDILIRRLILEPGDQMPWHTDPFRRISTIVRGDALRIEYQDDEDVEELVVRSGQVDWDEPNERVHRAVNVGHTTYEEVVVFFLDAPDAIAQPEVSG